jgi:hypothetical protein
MNYYVSIYILFFETHFIETQTQLIFIINNLNTYNYGNRKRKKERTASGRG